MAWLSGLTGKAETFLNSLDQTAAKVLHEPNDENGKQPVEGLTAASHTPFLSQAPSAGDITPSKSVPAKLYDYKSSESAFPDFSPTANPKAEPASKKKTDKDEALFEFLNSPEPADRRKSTPASSTRHSRQSSSSSVISNKGGKTTEQPASSSTSGSSMVHVEMPGIIVHLL